MTLELSPIIEGAEDGRTLFFIQGWPDDASIWDAQVAALKDRYRCVRVNLPNYADGPRARWGYGTDTIVAALAECVRKASPGGPVTLVIHDWGAYWGYILHHRHPELVERLAGLDIAPHLKPSPAAGLGIVAYQWWLAGAFALGGPIGDRMTQGLARMLGAPAAQADAGQGEGGAGRLRADMNYPYRNVWQDIASGRARAQTAGYRPGAPLLFAYGKDKPFPFHSEQWLRHVERVGGEVLPLACGHWVQRQPEFTAALVDWLARTDAGL